MAECLAELLHRRQVDHRTMPDRLRREQASASTGKKRASKILPNFPVTNQDKMRDVHDKKGRSEIYMILRVFGIGSDQIGMSVYINPEQLRRDKCLTFTTSTSEMWSVVPGDGV